mmetsp:Transcript_95115/g.296091  ORF Transcript_95115/g.296091 Transcript_95115/m.296091 type:complete len:231 (-) Transcript_95115:104-796(-)
MSSRIRKPHDVTQVDPAEEEAEGGERPLQHRPAWRDEPGHAHQRCDPEGKVLALHAPGLRQQRHRLKGVGVPQGHRQPDHQSGAAPDGYEEVALVARPVDMHQLRQEGRGAGAGRREAEMLRHGPRRPEPLEHLRQGHENRGHDRRLQPMRLEEMGRRHVPEEGYGPSRHRAEHRVVGHERQPLVHRGGDRPQQGEENHDDAQHRRQRDRKLTAGLDDCGHRRAGAVHAL